MTTEVALDKLRAAGAIIWENQRYNSHYAIDQPALSTLIENGSIPVVHAGQPEVIPALRRALPNVKWLVVQLRCTRESARDRSIQRHTGDTAERLAAWDTTPVLADADYTIDTDAVDADGPARQIRGLVQPT
ncbi:kinase [Nocardia sp. KC 131]|uniref:kinase n=1 Tax=Nocardia arseniciresistens TaxID=3392119 RepID=UPI00398E838A